MVMMMEAIKRFVPAKRLIIITVIVALFFAYSEAIIRQSSGKVPKIKYNSRGFSPEKETASVVNKVRFTQKGYIQFLKYIKDVPTITEYTFCIWVNSQNLTHAHPLLSYSKHEEERLIRVWISPHGTHLNLEIMGVEIFQEEMAFRELQWYHICQSWAAQQATWNLYINGKLKSNGFVPKLRGVPIKSGGDIVVGQEYTDFDKGLDDGIEGDVSGFNFVLASTSHSVKSPLKPFNNHYNNYDLIGKRQYFEPVLAQRNNNKLRYDKRTYVPLKEDEQSYDIEISTNVPQVLSYFNVQPNREAKGLFDLGKSFLNGLFDWWDTPPLPPRNYYNNYNNWNNFGGRPHKNAVIRTTNDIYNENGYQRKPLGLKLVELSQNCALGKGAPLSGKGVLISWTKTPVRVFGGAILKSVRPFCQSHYFV